jgi:hypothetical protein
MLPSFLGICHGGGGGECPPEGTVLFNTVETLPIAEGGAYVTIYGTNCPTQECNVNYLADGACGQYVDWTSKSNIVYRANGANLTGGFVAPLLNGTEYADNVQFADTNGAFTTINGTNYYKYRYNTWVAKSDGTGGYFFDYAGGEWWPYMHLTDVTLETEVPTGSSVFYPNGTYRYWYQSNDDTLFNIQGSYYSAGTLIAESITGSSGSVEVPTSSGNYFDSENTGHRYEWDGSGGYNDITTWFKPYGTFITNDSGTDYYWDGVGGYYS